MDFATGAGLAQEAWAEWDPAVDGRRWAKGQRSRLVLPWPEATDNLLLLLSVDPYLVEPILRQQTLRVSVNGVLVRSERLEGRSVVACPLDPAATRGGTHVVIEFEHPDTVQPSMVSDSRDCRPYSVAFRELLLVRCTPQPRPPQVRPGIGGMQAGNPPARGRRDDDPSPSELMKHFASLGDNCEFGMAQRQAGAEPMDLMRFVGVKPHGLLHGIENAFEDIADLNDLRFELFRGTAGTVEYVLKHRKYDLDAHTTVEEGSIDVDAFLAREVRRLTVLQRLFRADLESGQRVFVYKRNNVGTLASVTPILTRLRRWGPNVLLWVVLADEAHPPGTVTQVQEGLMQGYVDRFNPYDDAAASTSPFWIDVCRNAYRLWCDS